MARQRISYADIRTDSLYRDVDRLLDELTPGQLRQAYTAARSTLQKRVVRIEEAGLESPVVESFRSSVPTLATIAEHTQKAKTDKFIARQLVRVLNILDQPMASVKEIRSINARTANTLNTLLGLDESGSTLSTGNLKEFGHFMEYARSIGLALLYDSRDIAQTIADYIADTPGDRRTMEGWRGYFEKYMEMDEEAGERQKAMELELRGRGKDNLRQRVREFQAEIQPQNDSDTLTKVAKRARRSVEGGARKEKKGGKKKKNGKA